MNWLKHRPGHLRQIPFLVSAALAGLTFAFLAMAPTLFVLGFLCLLVAAAIGLLLQMLLELRAAPSLPRLLQTLLDLSRQPTLAAVHADVAESLRNIGNLHDPVFRSLADARLQSMVSDCEILGSARVHFPSTESWRVVYEEILRSPGLHLYRSIAHIESAHYWQDGPGQQSTQLNLELQQQQLITIERMGIVADHLWPENELFPAEPVRTWLDVQHRHGIAIRLVRESHLSSDSDLLCDLGIYGSRAVGFQTADPAGRTIRFTLDFNFEKVQAAEAAWNRLSVYSISFQDLLDQQH